MSRESLYLERNRLLHVATSYRGKTTEHTQQVRLDAWNKAFKLSLELELAIAESVPHTEAPKTILIMNKNNPKLIDTIYLLLEDNGITRRYVRATDWLPTAQKINPKSLLERYRYHEARVDVESLELREMVDKLTRALAPTAN